MQKYKYIYQTLAIALFVLLVVFQLYKVFTTPFWFDDAIFAIVAKNLAMKKGYAIVLFDTLATFHHGITAGPIIILPAALMIALFGNAYWVPGLTSVSLIVVLLILAFRQLRHFTPLIQWQCTAFFLLTTVLLTNHEIGFTGENMLVWHALLGEVPSAMFVIIAALFIAHQRYNSRIVFWGGIIAGLGGLCKLQSLIGSGVLGVYLAASYFGITYKSQMPVKQAVKNLFFYGAGVFLPLIAFEIVKMASLGTENYLTMMTRLLFTLTDYNNTPGMLVLFTKLYILGQYLGICSNASPTTLQAVLLTLLLVGFLNIFLYFFLRYIRDRDQCIQLTSLQWAAEALLWCAGAHLFWYVVINSVPMPRYLTQGIFYGGAAAALLISQIPRQRFFNSNICFAIFAITALYARSDAAEYVWKGMHYSEYLEEQQHVYKQLEAIQAHEPDTLFFSCGYVFEMEYLFLHTANFILCDKIHDSNFAHRKRILLSYTPQLPGKLLYGSDEGHRVFWREIPEPIKKLCPANDIYAGKHYFIASCHIR